MQLGFSFAILMASLLVTMTAYNVEAAPAKRGAGMITLGLKRVPHKRDGIHPHIYMQQHLNRGHRRLARMTGRTEPTQEELRANIHKRMALIEEQERALDKRYNRQGVPYQGAKVDAAMKAISQGATGQVAGATGGSVGAGAAVGASATAAGTGIAGAAAVGAQGAGTQAGVAAQGSNATGSGSTGGVSPIDLAAQQDPSLLTAANNPTANDSLGLAIESDDVGYIATVQMGTPPKNFNLLMDSGSADLWVGNAQKCQSQAGGGCGNHTFLGQSTSSSFVDTQQPFQVSYGSGEVAGTICTDNIVMAGLPLNKHTFGTAQMESTSFSSDQTPFDGLMGLAQSCLSQQKVPTPVESLAKAGQINAAITSFKISRLSDQKNDGEVTFGGLDSNKFQANTLTTFANVNKQGFWEGSMPAISVNGQDAGLQGRTAILDTGTTLIQAPSADATAVHQLIPGAKSAGQGMFTVPCTTNASVALTFGNTSFAIDPKDLAVTPVDNNDPTGDCMSGIGAGNVGGNTEWLVGDVFLKNAYFSTDEGQNQISLAKLA